MNYKNWRVDGNPEVDLLVHDKGTSRILVQADISSCFPSIYTHSIPWALVGKSVAKQNHDPEEWFNKIDKACQAMRNGETHGLHIGPHASNILSEIILTVIDNKLYDKGYRFIRNIDDYDCFVESYDKAQMFLCDLQEALREFDLPLNHKKTKITELPIALDKNWKHQLSSLPTIGKSGMVEYPQVNAFIDSALQLATESGNFAIINFSIKKLKEATISENGMKLAAKRFMHIAMLYPYLLPLMEEYVFKPYRVEAKDIKKFSDAIFRDASRVNDYESMCYSFYFAIKFDFTLDDFEQSNSVNMDRINSIVKTSDCILITIAWIFFMKRNHGKRDATEVKPFNRLALKLAKEDMDRYWLFCYEVLSIGNLSGEWKKMKTYGTSFIRKDILGKFIKGPTIHKILRPYPFWT